MRLSKRVKEHKIDLRVTDLELAKIQRLGKRRNLNISTTIRRMIDNYDGRTRV